MKYIIFTYFYEKEPPTDNFHKNYYTIPTK